MRLGFFLGFLIGTAIATVMSDQEAAQTNLAESGEGAAAGPIDSVRRHLREAVQAGREAAAEKERELQRAYEDSTSRQ